MLIDRLAYILPKMQVTVNMHDGRLLVYECDKPFQLSARSFEFLVNHVHVLFLLRLFIYQLVNMM